LVVADGFYEWKKLGPKTKEPYLFTLREETPFAFAGLWDRWAAPDGSELESCTIVTTAANELLVPLHDRMPVILSPDDYGVWLDPAVDDPNRLLPLLVPFAADKLKSERVSPVINNARNDLDPRMS
jgi:putative SOS response-associated peptidase YedK